jgi:hypothetical protein
MNESVLSVFFWENIEIMQLTLMKQMLPDISLKDQ